MNLPTQMSAESVVGELFLKFDLLLLELIR
jgi:hypothetical protein